MAAEELPQLTALEVVSSLDGQRQPVLVWAPASAQLSAPASAPPAPILVYLHSWSGDYRQKNVTWQREAVNRGWIYLHPNFRGRNRQPEACGSKLARQDTIDALDYALEHYRVDRQRVYLAGSSGGGHMAMLTAAYFPERFTAASAWVGISDLAEWYRFHAAGGKFKRYSQDILACLGEPPGKSAAIDAEYRARSPIFHLQRIGDLPIELCAGVHDGHSGSVPIPAHAPGF